MAICSSVQLWDNIPRKGSPLGLPTIWRSTTGIVICGVQVGDSSAGNEDHQPGFNVPMPAGGPWLPVQ